MQNKHRPPGDGKSSILLFHWLCHGGFYGRQKFCLHTPPWLMRKWCRLSPESWRRQQMGWFLLLLSQKYPRRRHVMLHAFVGILYVRNEVLPSNKACFIKSSLHYNEAFQLMMMSFPCGSKALHQGDGISLCRCAISWWYCSYTTSMMSPYGNKISFRQCTDEPR